MKRVFLENSQIHRKTPVPGDNFLRKLTKFDIAPFFHRTPPVAASELVKE